MNAMNVTIGIGIGIIINQTYKQMSIVQTIIRHTHVHFVWFLHSQDIL